jgi:NADH:ubiquinone oxidoreductase subunit K
MAQKNKTPQKPQGQFIFGKRNYMLMSIGIILIAIGFILMSGGSSADVNHFNKAIFDFRRIRLAPTLVLIGLGVQIFAILANPNKK